MTEDIISNFENRSIEIIQSEQQREHKIKSPPQPQGPVEQ